MKHHVSNNWLRHLQVCVLAMPRLGVWGTLWAARESSYWFSFAAFASWHAEHGEIEEPAWRGSVSTTVERKSKYQTTEVIIRVCRREEIFSKSLAWVFFWCLLMYRNDIKFLKNLGQRFHEGKMV